MWEKRQMSQAEELQTYVEIPPSRRQNKTSHILSVAALPSKGTVWKEWGE